MTINVHIFLTVHRHGKTHNIVQRKDIPQQPEKIQKEHTVFNYHSARLQLGLFMANLSDAIKHGDGQRLLRCYKFALHVLLCYKHKHTKYAFVLLSFFSKFSALLSEREGQLLVSNRFVNLKGGTGNNIPLDL